MIKKWFSKKKNIVITIIGCILIALILSVLIWCNLSKDANADGASNKSTTENKFESKSYLKERNQNETSSSKTTVENKENVTNDKDKKYSTCDDGSYTYSRPLSYNEKLQIMVYFLTLEKNQVTSRSDYDYMSESQLDDLMAKVYSQVENMYNVTESDIQIIMLDNDMEIYKEANSRVNY